VAFLKNYRREKLEGARFAPMDVLEKWYKQFYCQKNKACLIFFEELFYYYPEMRTRMLDY
jgi:hypothetical protein